MGKIVLLFFMAGGYLLASDGSGETDIIQRTVNFLIFAGLIWYLVADPIKGFFASRSQGIASEMQKVQDRLKETLEAKKEAEEKVAKAKKFAEDLLENSKKENKILSEAILAQCNSDMEIMGKSQVSLMEFEQRKMVKALVDSTLQEALAGTSGDFNKESMANIILKKVA